MFGDDYRGLKPPAIFGLPLRGNRAATVSLRRLSSQSPRPQIRAGFLENGAQAPILREIGVNLTIPCQFLATANERSQLRQFRFGKRLNGSFDLCQTRGPSLRACLFGRNGVCLLQAFDAASRPAGKKSATFSYFKGTA